MLLMCLAHSEVILSVREKKNREGRGGTGRGSSDMTGKFQAHRYIRRRWSSLLERQLCWYCSTPFSPCPLPMHTQIRFSYIFSTAYHVIVETYAHCCADMCAAPGSTGSVRDTWCTEKILLILLLLSFFSSCFPLLYSLLCCSFHF